MKALTVAAALSFALVTVQAFAQTTQKPPVKPPATQTPPAPTQKPTPPPTPAQQPQPPKPFPEGAKVAYFNPQEIVNASRDGKAGTAKLNALREKKVKEIQDKQKQLETDNNLINSPTLAEDKRAGLQKEIDRLQVDIQRMQQDAQQEMQEMQNDLQNEFGRKLAPVVQQIATEKGLHMVFVVDQSIYWADPGLDITNEIVKRLDAGSTTKSPSPAPNSPSAQR
jgi:outer membrane protein